MGTLMLPTTVLAVAVAPARLVEQEAAQHPGMVALAQHHLFLVRRLHTLVVVAADRALAIPLAQVVRAAAVVGLQAEQPERPELPTPAVAAAVADFLLQTTETAALAAPASLSSNTPSPSNLS
jgi:hypothetical protein